jgi:peptide deformylase
MLATPLTEIRVVPDQVLSTPTLEVRDFDAALKSLVAMMTEIMYKATGVGLAANQVGVTKSVFVYDARDDKGPRVVVNPRIIEATGEATDEEGCLSIPGKFYPITRCSRLTWVGYSVEGYLVQGTALDLEARIFQHEIDHLRGKCLLNHVSSREKFLALGLSGS